MKNPIDYFKDSFKSVDNIKNEILSKKQEIDTCKKQLDVLYYRQRTTAHTVSCLSGKLAQEATPPPGNV